MEQAVLIIPGLRYLPDFVNVREQADLLAVVDAQPWLTDLKRRVQHYGYRYEYRSRSVDPTMYLGPLPEWADRLLGRFYQEKLVDEAPDQVIVNEYEPGQGIAAHVDCVPCFGGTIVSLSLGSPCVMVFTRKNPAGKVSVLVEPGSLLVMQGEARYEWRHAIPARRSDVFDGKTYGRGRRVSLTFRSVIKGG